jgi:hypothetical protein
MKKPQRFIVLGDNDVLVDSRYIKSWEKIQTKEETKVIIKYPAKETLTITWVRKGLFRDLLISLCLIKLAKLMDQYNL